MAESEPFDEATLAELRAADREESERLYTGEELEQILQNPNADDDIELIERLMETDKDYAAGRVLTHGEVWKGVREACSKSRTLRPQMKNSA
jgi:hypothetical protein